MVEEDKQEVHLPQVQTNNSTHHHNLNSILLLFIINLYTLNNSVICSINFLKYLLFRIILLCF